MPITRSQAQKSACKGLGRNGQTWGTYILAYAHNALASPETCT
ncbi:Malolactic regulator [Lacticaseibacillus rhamnosus]|nr:Malolactic regulator [Lacticaseibacillus rhamnosus]AXI94236.1 Malolactic regulator [Lacticaseibacillus rhamnosus GG]AZZ22910.1 Malolactic regulator [Lacticaseibacillus rhamnosus]MCT3190905.1 Malolactic regulator [Lacticaseibacillus rhamnosus]MCT3373397.1 Malolactic regulator [Lacticaseibacillus rhamnosus]